MDTERGAQPRSKVARLIEAYGLSGVGDELERRWTRLEDRASLRELADYFNRRLLRAAIEEGDSEPLDGEIDNLYRLLTADEVTSGARQEARNRIAQRGVDAETLEDDFVSYQSIRTYLKKYRDVSPPDDSTSPQEHRNRKRETVQRLKARLASVTERALTELRSADALTLGDFDVIVTVRVYCNDCETQHSLTELVGEAGCDCQ